MKHKKAHSRKSNIKIRDTVLVSLQQFVDPAPYKVMFEMIHQSQKTPAISKRSSKVKDNT